MKQVIQPLGGGPVSVLDVPRPTIGPAEVLVRTLASVISPGTERAVTSLAQSSLMNKARARPDLVRQVVKKARTEGIGSTLHTVRSRLASDLPLGYSAAGIAVAVGEAVESVRPGQLVATGGAGHANHAEWQAVPGLLCATVPDGVSAQDAAFTTLASIALHGLRLADVGPGSKVVVVGLGLVGQLACRLAQAAGCDVAGIDVVADPLRVAEGSGVLALTEQGEATTQTVLSWSRGRGADAVLLCASGSSSAAARRAPALCRDRARVVVVGDVGLELSRTPFYEKELTLLFARSYGPGRYERGYEEYGVDYPVGQVRWTEGRNFEAVLDLLASGRLQVDDLITHKFAIAAAAEAYELIEARSEPYLAVALTYPTQQAEVEPPIVLSTPAGRSGFGVGWIGAGAYSTGTLLPAFQSAGFDRFVAVVSGSGLSARRVAERHGFEKAVSTAAEVIDDPDIDVVVIATPHDTHAALATRALRAGKHVWCEKPVALTLEDLDEVERAWQASGRVLFSGYNRRWSPVLKLALDHLASTTSPRTIVYRVSAGEIPPRHWYEDRRQGGRVRGEVCHFVDTAQALAGAPVAAVAGLAAVDDHELGAGNHVGVLLSFLDGSLATIAYGPSTAGGKELIEVVSGERRVVIRDFKQYELDEKRYKGSSQDKGHNAAVRAFYHALAVGGEQPGPSLQTTRWTLLALDHMAHGQGLS